MARILSLFAAVSLAFSASALACNDHAPGKEPKNASATRESPWIAGQVRDVDIVERTVTVGHGKIESLGVSSMLLKADNAKILAAARPGDKIRFRMRVIDDQPILTRLAVSNEAEPSR